MKTVLSKVMKIGRTTALCAGLAVMVVATVGMASPATAANGSNFVLGKLTNTATAITRLTGNVAGPTMQFFNTNTAGNARALDLVVDSGNAPMAVNASAGTATNLSADKLDRKDSTAFFSGKTYQVSQSGVFTGGGGTLARALPPNCDSGDKMIGGGGIGGNEDDLVGSEPVGNVQFAITVRDNGPGSTITATGLCADFPPLRAGSSVAGSGEQSQEEESAESSQESQEEEGTEPSEQPEQ